MPFSLAKRLSLSQLKRSDRRPRRAGVALGLEPLEERWLPNATVITVTTVADDPITPIAGQTTLRDAINQANQTTGTTIEFAPIIYGQTIQPTSALPEITGAGTTIEGLGMNITLDGSKAPPIWHGPPGIPLQAQPLIFSVAPDGLGIAASNVTIEGLKIANWYGSGVSVGGANTKITDNEIVNNADGIFDGARNLYIVRNTISDNFGSGVVFEGEQDNVSGNYIVGNTISGNSWDGIEILGGSQDTIQDNSIYGNGDLGIFLGYTNDSIRPPVLASVSYVEEPGLTSWTVRGSVTLPPGTPSGTCTLEIFANSPGSNPQGQISLGKLTFWANGGATIPFALLLNTPSAFPGDSITATVTDPNGDTSQFSNAVPATQSSSMPSPSPATPTTPPPSFVQAAITLYIDGAEMLIDQLEGFSNPNLAGVNASIAFESPYAGPFAELFELAGEAAMAEQLSVTT